MSILRRTPLYTMAEITQQVADITELQKQYEFALRLTGAGDIGMSARLIESAQQVLERMYESVEGKGK
jgi:hypothetical protein